VNVPIKRGTARRLSLRLPPNVYHAPLRWSVGLPIDGETHLWLDTGWFLETSTVGQEVVEP
jgi:hypothetical protein